jgi:hypothetical protein
MLGDDRPDQIAARDGFSRGFPEFRIVGSPVRDPGRIRLAHHFRPFSFLWRRGGSSRRRRPTLQPANRSTNKKTAPGEGAGASSRTAALLSARHWTDMALLEQQRPYSGIQASCQRDASRKTLRIHIKRRE